MLARLADLTLKLSVSVRVLIMTNKAAVDAILAAIAAVFTRCAAYRPARRKLRMPASQAWGLSK
jgi:hypothetical protein